MMEFGKSLRAAREAKGFTVAQMAELTHLAPTTVNELESEDFSRIAAPIYGRGFVKLYCEAVGLDPKPFVAEFMEIFSGNHDTGIRERQASMPPAEPKELPTPVPSPEDRPQPDPSDDLLSDEPLTESAEQGSAFDAEATPEQDPVTGEKPPLPNPQPALQRDLFGNEIAATRPNVSRKAPTDSVIQPPAAPCPTAAETPMKSSGQDDHAFSRYAAPLRQLDPIVHSSAWRIGILAAAATALLVLIVLGVRTAYRATMTAPASDSTVPVRSETPVTSEKKTAAAPKGTPTKNQSVATKAPAATARKPQRIPALYVD